MPGFQFVLYMATAPIPVFIATLVMAPVYYFTANKLERGGQIVITLLVALVFFAVALGAATSKTDGNETATFYKLITVLLFAPLASGWIVCAFVCVLAWLVKRRSSPSREGKSRPERNISDRSQR